MECKELKKVLEQYMESGRINEDALKHIDACKDCAREYNIIKEMKEAFAVKESVKIPQDFNETVWKKLDEGQAFSWQRAFKSVFSGPAVPAMATAVTAILVIAFVLKFSTVNNIQKIAQITKPVTIKAENKTAVLQKKVQQKKQEIIAAVKKAINQGNHAQAKNQETAQNKAPQQNQAPLPQDMQPQQIAQLPAVAQAQAKEIGMSSVRQTSQPAQNTKNINEAEAKDTPTAETSKESLLIKNNVIDPVKGESVTIQYNVTQPANILIKVYDRLGENIKTIESSYNKQPGLYSDYWNGDDDTGAQVSSGIYIIYIKTGLVETKTKVCIIK